jgi:transglutaminase-like putative cysteine protease
VNDNLKKPVAVSDRLKKALVQEAPPAPVPRLGNWRTWLNLLLLFLTLGVAVFSIERAEWLMPQPAFTLVLFLSMLFIWLLVIARLPGWVIHIVAPLTGVLVAVWQSIFVLSGAHTFNHLLTVLRSWFQDSGTLLPGEEKVVFALVITFLVWLIGYLGTWFVLRKHNAWVAVALGAVVIIVNISNLPAGFYYFFPAYFLAAVFLVIQTRIAAQYVRTGRGSGYTTKSLLFLFVPLICIVVLAASLAWVTPQARATSLQNLIATSFGWQQDVKGSKINIFNAVPSKQAVSIASTLTEVDFETGWNQGDSILFKIDSNRPSYWVVNAYDTYTPKGWINSPTSEQSLDAKENWMDANSVDSADLTRYKVTVENGADVLLLAGDLVTASAPVLVRQNAGGDVTGITLARLLGAGESYSVQTVQVDPTENQLSRAGADYPQYVEDIYLQLPDGYSPEIKALSENITAGAATPYEKVLDIVKYLKRFPYEAIIDAPPEGTDGVSYFLFTEKRGFCLYFASALAVMLRNVDVPARLAVGYLPGEPGQEKGTYILRDWHYHAWTQVYFPGYGWVNFEATPSGAAGSESQVSAETPLVSDPTIRELPQWNAWYYFPPPVENIPSASPPVPTTTESVQHRVEYPFASELGQALVIIFLIVFALLLLAVLLLIARRTFLRRLWHVERKSLASTTYNKLCRLASMAKIYPRPQQTPLEFAAELRAALPDEAESIDRLVQAYQENRYGHREGKPGLIEEAQVLKARNVVYENLLRLMGKRNWSLKLFAPGVR